MKILTGYLGLLTLLFQTAGFSQTKSPELSVALSSEQFDVVPIGNQGFLILEFQKNTSNQLAGIQLQRFDTLLQMVWQRKLVISQRSNPVIARVADGHYYLMATDPSSRDYEIFEVGLEHGQLQKTNHRYSSPFFVNDLAAHDHRLWLAGSMLNQGVLFSLELKPEASPKIMPIGFTEPVQLITQLHYDAYSESIGYFLYTSLNKQKVYVFRRIDLNGKVRNDLVIKSEPKYHLGQLHRSVSQGRIFLVGTYFKQQGDKVLGIFTSEIDQGQILPLRLTPFKEIVTKKISFDDLVKGKPASDFSKKDWGPTMIDTWELGPAGLLLSLEILTKDYQVKGTVQQEFDKQEILAQIDQNTYGRRDMDAAAALDGQTLDDRMSNYSATDIMQYKYLDALVGQASFKGYTYDQTILLTFDTDLTLQTTHAVNMGSHRIYFGSSGSAKWQGSQIRLAYQQGEDYRTATYDPKSRSFPKHHSYSAAQNSVVLPWFADRYLITEVDKEKGKKQLRLQPLVLE